MPKRRQPSSKLRFTERTLPLLHAICKRKRLQFLDLILHLKPAGKHELNTEYLCRYVDSDLSIRSQRFGEFTSTQQFALKVLKDTKRGGTISSREKFSFKMPTEPELHNKYIPEIEQSYDEEECRVISIALITSPYNYFIHQYTDPLLRSATLSRIAMRRTPVASRLPPPAQPLRQMIWI